MSEGEFRSLMMDLCRLDQTQLMRVQCKVSVALERWVDMPVEGEFKAKTLPPPPDEGLEVEIDDEFDKLLV